MTSDMKAPISKLEIDGYVDALARVKEAIASYERHMFVGGPKPSEVLSTIMHDLVSKSNDASQRGPITANKGV